MRFAKVGLVLGLCVLVSACNGISESSPNSQDSQEPGTTVTPDHRPNPTPSPSAIPSASPTPTTPIALVFNGTGTSPTDTDALVAILQSHSITYQVVTSAQLEAMTAAQLAQYKLIVWPGGDSITQTNGLDANTRERVREAVVNSGVNFAGFCAGAFIAVGPAPAAGGTPGWGLAIVNANYVTEYYPNGAGNPQPIATIVPIAFPNGITRDLVWWDGPFLPSLSSSVVAKYPGGSAAMIETNAGKGFVVLTGVHPEAPQSWRDEESLTDPDGLDTDVAWSLINAALSRVRLQTL